MGAYLRRPYLAITIDGTAVQFVTECKCTFGFDQRVSEATFRCAARPPGAAEDAEVRITMGANQATARQVFIGIIRTLTFSNSPRSVTIQAYGYLQKAVEYENWEDSQTAPTGGLNPIDLTGHLPATASEIVTAVINKAGIPGAVVGSIGSTTTLYGLYIPAFTWRCGHNVQNPNLFETGESAMSYIERYDEIDAELDAADSGGRYRTFETVGSITYRFRVGGRPRGENDFVLTEGIDILTGSFDRTTKGLRDYIVVKGFDTGGGTGPFCFPTTGDIGYGGDTKRTFVFSSEMIERAHELDFGPGMSCERVSKVLMLDYNREFVVGSLVTFRDDAYGIAQTHLVQGGGGAPDRLGVGERLWVTRLEISINRQGYRQRISYLGGGSPDGGLPDPPG